MDLESLTWLTGVLGGGLVVLSIIAFYLTHYRLKKITGPVARVLWLVMLSIACIVAMEGFLHY